VDPDVSADSLAADLLDAERRLQAAQRSGDVAVLDQLLDDRLVAVSPLGTRATKADDLDAYRSGRSVVTDLTEEHLELLVADTTGVSFVVASVAGTFENEPFTARLRYTRTWIRDGAMWRVLAAHIETIRQGQDSGTPVHPSG
jgi:hypothetical protein